MRNKQCTYFTVRMVSLVVVVAASLFLPGDSFSLDHKNFARKLTDVGWLQEAIQTKDDAFVLVITGNSRGRIILRKINSAGEKLWQRQLVGSMPIVPQGIDGSADGSIFMTVSYRNGLGKFAVLKLNSRGGIEWNVGFQQPQECQDELPPTVLEFDSVAATPDGGALAAGPYRGGFCIDPTEIGTALTKFSSSGVIEWSKWIHGGFGGFGAQVQATSDGGFIVHVERSLVKLNSIGEVEWARSIAKKNFQFGTQPDTDGGFILVGSDQREGKLLWAKLDSSGNLLWKKAVALQNFSIRNVGLELNISPGGGHVLFGSAVEGKNVQGFLANASDDGNIQSVTLLGENEFPYVQNVYATAAGSTVVFGNEKGNGTVLFSALDSKGAVASCILPSVAVPIRRSFGKLGIAQVDINEGSLLAVAADLRIESKPFHKRDSDLCASGE